MTVNPNGITIPAGRLVHVVFRTAKFEEMVTFYKTLLGAHANYENDFLAFLTHDEEHHRIAIARIPPPPADAPVVPGPKAGMDHMAFTFDNLRQLAAVYKERKACGIVPVWCVNHGPTMSMYYQDPDGNRIEFQVDSFATPEEANAFMKSPEFAENSFGVDYDPEDFVRRVESGEDEATIKKRPNIGPRDLSTVPGAGERF